MASSLPSIRQLQYRATTSLPVAGQPAALVPRTLILENSSLFLSPLSSRKQTEIKDFKSFVIFFSQWPNTCLTLFTVEAHRVKKIKIKTTQLVRFLLFFKVSLHSPSGADQLGLSLLSRIVTVRRTSCDCRRVTPHLLWAPCLKNWRIDPQKKKTFHPIYQLFLIRWATTKQSTFQFRGLFTIASFTLNGPTCDEH